MVLPCCSLVTSSEHFCSISAASVKKLAMFCDQFAPLLLPCYRTEPYLAIILLHFWQFCCKNSSCLLANFAPCLQPHCTGKPHLVTIFAPCLHFCYRKQPCLVTILLHFCGFIIFIYSFNIFIVHTLEHSYPHCRRQGCCNAQWYNIHFDH